jgi:hypothetical protein
MLSSKILKIKNHLYINPYNSTSGQFFIYDTKFSIIDGIHSCRELFSEFFTCKTEYVGFTFSNHKDININKVVKFFEYIERRLKNQIPSNKTTIVYSTNIKNVIILKISPFWRENNVRRAMFTLFLRCACVHYKTSFKAAIINYALAYSIQPTINYFLKGNTIPTFRHSYLDDEIVDRFSWASEEFINRQLKKPTAK